MKSAVLNPAARLIVVGIIVVASACAAEPAAPSPRSVRSAAYRVEVGGLAVFTQKFRDVNYAAFVLSAPVEVVVRSAAPIRTFNVSPHAAGIIAASQGAALTFKLDRPRHLVVTINEGEKLFLFGEAPETSPPRPGAPGVTSVLDLGIDATGSRLETDRLQQAIDRVAAAGGVLHFPPGVYLTGTLSLKSNLRLHLDQGARLLGSNNPDDYPPDPGGNEADTQFSAEVVKRLGRYDAAYRRLLLVDGAQNVRVTGRGTIEGQGGILRPLRNIAFILVRRSSDVVFEDLTLLDSPMYNAHVVGSDRVTFRRLKIVSDQAVANTDGIDPDSSRDVLVDHCFFHCADDCISIKTSGQSGVKGNAERITVRNCVFISRTSATKFGNETTAGAQRDILFENNDVLEADRAITLSCMDGNHFENLRFIDTRVERLVPMGMKLQLPVHVHVRQRWPGGGSGRIHNVLFRNLSIEQEDAKPSRLAGFSAEHDVRGVRFENYTIAGRVRLNAADANLEIGPFVSDVSFAGPSWDR